MADDLHTVEIVFKATPHAPVRYRMTSTERDRLGIDYQQSSGQGAGVYDALSEQGEARKLMIPFSEVLYIG